LTRYLLDTAILVYLLQTRPLPAQVAALLQNDAGPIFYSPVNVAEVGIKFAKQQLPLPAQVGADLLLAVRQIATRAGLIQLPLAEEHAVRLATLPRIHNDPFDRLLIAQAVVEDLMLVSSNGVLPRYPGLKLFRF